MSAARDLVVLWAGNTWDSLPATDHHLARAFAPTHDVLWIDPPRSAHIRPEGRSMGLQQVEPGIQVLDVPMFPAPSRPVLRELAHGVQHAALAATLRRLGRRPWVTMVCSARAPLPARGDHGVRVLHVTDDWVAGAAMMGLDQAALRRVLERNVQTADVVSAVSVDLARDLEEFAPRRPVAVVPNGATVAAVLPQIAPADRRREAVLVGQLNERLDFSLLQAVAEAGVPMRIMGPRTAREAATNEALDRLVATPGVTWLGPVAHADLAENLATGRVGLTPYVINDFNRASFPLKTLEYLALGLPVVSTPLESLEWLDTDLVDVAATPEEFAAAVLRRVDEPIDPAADEARRAFADQHSWQARVAELVRLANEARGN